MGAPPPPSPAGPRRAPRGRLTRRRALPAPPAAARVEERVQDVTTTEEFREALAAAGNKLVVLEAQSDEVGGGWMAGASGVGLRGKRTPPGVLD
jgi:hypothetical protein